MATNKSTTVPVSGLLTNPNKLAVTPGSCAVANNVVLRQPGTISPLVQTDVYYTPTAGSSIPVLQLFAGDTLVTISKSAAGSGSKNSWVSGQYNSGSFFTTHFSETENVSTSERSSVAKSYSTTRILGFVPGQTQLVNHRSRYLLSEQQGVLTWNQPTASSDAISLRVAGLLPPTDPLLDGSPISVKWLLALNDVAYRTCYSYAFTAEGRQYELFGPVSSVSFYRNVPALPTGIGVRTYLHLDEPFPRDGLLYLNVYRTPQAAVTDPGEIGDDFRLVRKLAILDSDWLAGSIYYEDTTTEVARDAGSPLYSNESQEGPGSSRYAPPIASGVAVYHDVVYYANKASQPILALSVKDAFGFLPTTSQRRLGIGQRVVFGILASSSSTITLTDYGADSVGLEVGQKISSQNTGLTGTITAVGPDPTITVSFTNFVTVDTGPFEVFDMIKITATYADGSTATVTDTVFELGYRRASAGIAGFRIFHGRGFSPEDFDYGYEFSIIYPLPAMDSLVGFRVAATNGQNYSPPVPPLTTAYSGMLPAMQDTRKNLVWCSKAGEPEAVPVSRNFEVGSGTIFRLIASQSCLFALASDGLWKITGETFPPSVTQIDPDVQIVHPDAVCSIDNNVYAWITDGLASITENGAVTVSTDAIGPDLRAQLKTIQRWGAPYVWGVTLSADQFWNEVWLNLCLPRYENGATVTPQVFLKSYILNTDTSSFTTQTAEEFQSTVYSSKAARLLFTKSSGTGSSTITNLLVSKDFYPEEDQLVHPATVFFNPITTGDAGFLKQWIDVNFLADYYDLPEDSGLIQAIFEQVTGLTSNIRTVDVNTQDLHFWVPRRVVLKDQLNLGIVTPVLIEETNSSTPFKLYGFTVRFRAASETFNR